jgi:hypothetical protein
MYAQSGEIKYGEIHYAIYSDMGVRKRLPLRERKSDSIKKPHLIKEKEEAG